MPVIHPVFFFYDKPGCGSYSLPITCSSFPEDKYIYAAAIISILKIN